MTCFGTFVPHLSWLEVCHQVAGVPHRRVLGLLPDQLALGRGGALCRPWSGGPLSLEHQEFEEGRPPTNPIEMPSAWVQRMKLMMPVLFQKVPTKCLQFEQQLSCKGSVESLVESLRKGLKVREKG